MQVIDTSIDQVKILRPKVFEDDRGFFYEAWNQERFDEIVGRRVTFCQDNHSRSVKGVLRGLHYQLPRPQGKLVRCAVGSIWDVAVDLRRSSPTFGQWFGTELSEENALQLWIPEGFAHGFVTLSEAAEVLYKATDLYYPAGDRSIRFDDPELAIDWPVLPPPGLMSAKDLNAPLLADAEVFE